METEKKKANLVVSDGVSSKAFRKEQQPLS